ncbi:hypothetical protein T4A_9829 [Trichinella pseudospiralis]|uniref:Uncharacterized protein n=1 Tax=Trichinella pseudospiralis TaxID=6337 RepID=A0A0V1CYC4_TRIPS|nr:hypothetical protein T4A_9829 [Trichinella pseudospiralis]
MFYASGYASGIFSKISKFSEFLPQALPQATPQGIKKFAYALRLRPWHFIAQYLPLGYVNICICKFFVPQGYAWGVA